jgi:predicted porin
MKKSLLALAALTAFAGAASAQSSVTLFGIADLAVRNVKNGSPSIKSLSQDGNSSSRLGFRGVEDLGGGLRAGFWIEGAISPDTGGTGQTWARRSTLSLVGGFGEIRLGRDYTPTFWNHTVFDPFGTNGVASSTNLFTPGNTSSGSNTSRVLGVPSTSTNAGTGTLVRADNTIGYFLPAMGGLYGQLMVAAGEGAVGNKYVGGRIGYTAGPVNVAFAYGTTELAKENLKGLNFGASYNLGFMTLMGQLHKYEVDTAEPTVGGRELQNWLIGAIVPFGASTLKFSYAKSEGKLINLTAPDESATQLGLGYVYDLSKRTSLYTHFSRIQNKNGARFYASGSGPLAVFNGTNFTSTGYEFGVRHSF